MFESTFMAPFVRGNRPSSPHANHSGVQQGLTHAPKLLVIEDDFATRRVLAEFLTEEGFSVECAANGAEALELLRLGKIEPRLILLDIWMPYMDGLEFRAAQIAMQRAKNIPVIVMTAGGFHSNDAHGLGLQRILRKPLDAAELLEAIGDSIAST